MKIWLDDGKSMSRNVAALNILAHDVINLLVLRLFVVSIFAALLDIYVNLAS